MFRTNACLCLISLTLVFEAPTPGRSAIPKPRAAASALCIQHVGASDKPIFPIVIAVAERGVQACMNVLGDDGRYASVHKVSGAELTRMADRAQHLIDTARRPADPQAYGTFKITILFGVDSKVSVLSRQDTTFLIHSLLDVSKDRKLSDVLRSVKARIEH